MLHSPLKRLNSLLLLHLLLLAILRNRSLASVQQAQNKLMVLLKNQRSLLVPRRMSRNLLSQLRHPSLRLAQPQQLADLVGLVVLFRRRNNQQFQNNPNRLLHFRLMLRLPLPHRFLVLPQLLSRQKVHLSLELSLLPVFLVPELHRLVVQHLRLILKLSHQ